MPLTDPNLGLFYGWQRAESGWHIGMDANLRKLGALVHLAVKSRSAPTPPTSPSDGDRYIIPASASGYWAGHDGQIAVRVNGAWEYYVPAVGWVAYIEDEGKQIIYTASGWMLVDDVLGLGTMAQQDADNVNITGGQINANITGGTFHGVTPTAAGLALLDGADAAAQRATLGLGTLATQNNNAVVITGGSINGTTIGSTTRANGAFEKISAGAPVTSTATIRAGGPITGGTVLYGFISNGEVQPDVTGSADGYRSAISVADASFTVQSLRHFIAKQGTFGPSATVIRQTGFAVDANLTGAINNYGFYSGIPAGANRWNFYAGGTAQNRFAGRTIFDTGFARIPTVSTAPSGSTITLTSSTNHLLYNNASPVAALTINLPTSDVTNGQEITIATRSAITTLTINAGSKPVYGAPTTLAAGGFATFIYSSTAGAWFRKG